MIHSILRKLWPVLAAASILLALAVPLAHGQEQSVRPGINSSFENPDPDQFVERFEIESREVFANRQQILAACDIKPGMVVADVGAGTGLFTRLFARAVGPEGKVYAVDIAKNFIQHIQRTSLQVGIRNVTGVLCAPDSVNLPADSIDLAFICDTYHHFEFPFKTMASIHQALRPGGRVVLVDFRRIEGVSSDWVLNHVRAGQEIFAQEIVSCGFRQVEEPAILKENYCLIFEKVDPPPGQPGSEPQKESNPPPPTAQEKGSAAR